MNASNSAPILAIAIFAAFAIGLAVFNELVRKLRRTGGKVRTDLFALPELLSGLILAGFFVWIILRSVITNGREAAAKLTLEQVVPSTLPFLILFVGLAGFLKVRGISLREAFGLTQLSLAGAFGWGIGLICAAFPIVLAGNAVMQIVLQQAAEEQELVALFRDVARHANRAGAAQIALAGVIIAPFCEEFLFRGFFYAIGKRYVGALTSTLLTSALFAAVHLNLAALPGLFLLSITFIIAYEATGSLFVPMSMHAIFNAAQLGFLYRFAQENTPV